MFSPTDVITVLGKRGSGKSTLAKKIQSIYPRVVIFDRLQEYPKESGANFHDVSTFEGFGAAVQHCVSLQKFKIIFRFDVEATNHDAVFNEALRVLYYMGKECGGLCIVVEEAHNFASRHFLPQWFKECILTGRHKGLSIITTSQRPAEIHKTLLSQSHHIFCGMLHEKNDIAYLQSVMGDDALKLSQLRQFNFLHYSPGEKSKIVSNR